MSVFASKSQSGRRRGDLRRAGARSNPVIKPCTRLPPIKLEDVAIPLPEDLSTAATVIRHDMTAVSPAPPLPASSGHDDRYPCLRRALQCGETPILPLGTYAVEFGFDVSCALPFAALSSSSGMGPAPSSTHPTASGTRPAMTPTLRSRSAPDVYACPPPSPLGGAGIAGTFGSGAGHDDVVPDPSHACAVTHSLCHMNRVARQRSSTVPDASDHLACCSGGSPSSRYPRSGVYATASATVTSATLPSSSGRGGDSVRFPDWCEVAGSRTSGGSCSVTDSAGCSVEATKGICPTQQRFIGDPHSLPSNEHQHPFLGSTGTSGATCSVNPPATTEQSPTDHCQKSQEQDLSNLQKRYRNEPRRYVYAEVWKKDNRTWLWKRRDPNKQQADNLKTSDSNRRLTTHWKKDNRSWLWKSSSK